MPLLKRLLIKPYSVLLTTFFLLLIVESVFDQDFDPSFDLMITTAYKHISKRLLDTLMKDYHFMDHLAVRFFV